MKEKDYEYFCFLGSKCIQFTFKGYLRNLEGLLERDVINEDQFNYMRNEILDQGNDSIRFFNSQAEYYFNKES